MIAGILAIVAALIGYFASKKAGANDATAAAVGVAAGAGTYWTATQTEWGKAQVEKIDDWWSPTKTEDGKPVMDKDGNAVKLPPGVTVTTDGLYKKPDGTVVSTIGDVLKDWGPAGTAAVVGGTVMASKFKYESWMGLAGVGILLLVLLK